MSCFRLVSSSPSYSQCRRTILAEAAVISRKSSTWTSKASSTRAATTAASASSSYLSSSTSSHAPCQVTPRSFTLRHRQQARLHHALVRRGAIAAGGRSGISRKNGTLSLANTPIPTHVSPSQPTSHRPFSSTSAVSISPKALYAQKVEQGLLKEDPRQLIILEDLQQTYDDIMSYKPPPVPEPLEETAPSSSSSDSAKDSQPKILADLEDNTPTFFAAIRGLFSKGGDETKRIPPPIPPIPDDVPKSLYMFGDVGCGKSMLMDLLYDCLPDSIGKRRVHFHAFMIDVHKRLHRISSNAEHTGISKKGDAIVPVARELAKEGRVLCFDEFQVTDIADAMILRRLMESMLGYGFVIIITSNRAPKDLYKNGIQRKSFIPCISLIESHFKVRDLDSDTDYRKIPRALSKVYYDPITSENRLEFNKLFEGFTAGQRIVMNDTLEVWGRKLNVPLSTGVMKESGDKRDKQKVGDSVAMFTFDELCGDPLSAADYLEIVRNFDAVFITDLPQLTLSEKDKARRFITFIDAAYDSKTKLLTLSHEPITQIFSDKSASEPKVTDEGYTAHQRAMMDDLGLDAGTIGASSIFTGDEEIFAFARAVSRLAEMGTRQWAERVKGA